MLAITLLFITALKFMSVRLNLFRQPDGIKTVHENRPLGMSVMEVRLKLKDPP